MINLKDIHDFIFYYKFHFSIFKRGWYTCKEYEYIKTNILYKKIKLADICNIKILNNNIFESNNDSYQMITLNEDKMNIVGYSNKYNIKSDDIIFDQKNSNIYYLSSNSFITEITNNIYILNINNELSHYKMYIYTYIKHSNIRFCNSSEILNKYIYIPINNDLLIDIFIFLSEFYKVFNIDTYNNYYIKEIIKKIDNIIYSYIEFDIDNINYI